MSTDDLDRLLRLMLEQGLSHVSYEDGPLQISMTIAVEPPDIAPVTETARSEAVLLCSRAIGALLPGHPARPGETARTGDRVTAGQLIAYVRSGTCLSGVTAKTAGVLGRQLSDFGQVVGYGAPIFELFPDASV